MEVNKVYPGKMETVLNDCPDCFFDSCVTDPPYGLSFMGKKWDYDVPSVDAFKQIFRVLKPGAHMLVACGTRTQHRMAVNVEDAGFEIRDVICWHYGSGFPKSRDISKDIDKDAGAERKIIGVKQGKGGENLNKLSRDGGNDSDEARGLGAYGKGAKQVNVDIPVTRPATEDGLKWEGWGTALKPATEFWTLARKPFDQRTVATNVLQHGTGAINIDGCRIEKQPGDREEYGRDNTLDSTRQSVALGKFNKHTPYTPHDLGRWPANVTMDEIMAAEMDTQSDCEASRFFYCPKPDNFERNKGLDSFIKKDGGFRSNTSGQHLTMRDGGDPDPQANWHPTVKPIELMRWLIKLITPKAGIVLDPFCGSGSTLIGAKMEMKNFVGIDEDPEACKLSEARVSAWNPDKYIPQQLF